MVRRSMVLAVLFLGAYAQASSGPYDQDYVLRLGDTITWGGSSSFWITSKATTVLQGTTSSTSGTGVYGSASAISGTTYGVYGEAASPAGFGLYTPDRLYAGGQIVSKATGIPPFSVASALLVPNLNADMLDGLHAKDLGTIRGVTAGTGLAGGGTAGTVTLSLGPTYLTGSAYDTRFVKQGQASSISTAMIQSKAVTLTQIAPTIVSSINGLVSNGGNISLVGGTGISIAPAGNTITISAKGGFDHGLLTGLGDDDHPQYFNAARGDARYAKRGAIVDADISGSAAIAPTKIKGTAWTSLNDGPGSGLDADTLDGLHASQLVGVHFGSILTGSATVGLEMTNKGAAGILGFGPATIRGTNYLFGLYTPNDFYVGGATVTGTLALYDTGNNRRISMGTALAVPAGWPPGTFNGLLVRDAGGNVNAAVGYADVGAQSGALLNMQDPTDGFGASVDPHGFRANDSLDNSLAELSTDSQGGFLAVRDANGNDVLSVHVAQGATDNVLNVNGYASIGGVLSASAGVFSGNCSVNGDLAVGRNLTVNGIKSFLMIHPRNSALRIVYVCLEGGEAGTYIRGTAELHGGEARIQLPEHFALVTSEGSITVQLTPVGQHLQLYVVEKSPREIVVREASGKNGTFDYLVNGVRLGYENHQAIQATR